MEAKTKTMCTYMYMYICTGKNIYKGCGIKSQSEARVAGTASDYE